MDISLKSNPQKLGGLGYTQIYYGIYKLLAMY